MEKVTEKAKAKTAKKVTPKNGAKKDKATEAKVKKATEKVDAILNPTPESRVKRAEIFQVLAEKKRKIDSKLDELTEFNAGNDGLQSKMEFTADNGYRFTISNPRTIADLLTVVETQLFDLKKKTDSEIVNFEI